ncbi:MAG: glycine/betaine ABC transporter substrate-binding protein [Actinomycetota bacterium]|nr:glycine/betaine ABC transporter substrate-binding protein [Actinomycetota bacterium]
MSGSSGTALRVLGATSVLILALTGCGQAGSSRPSAGGQTSPGAGAQAKACEPVAGQELVVLEDDRELQTVDNVIPAVNAKAATEPLMSALDKVSQTLTTDDLVELNRKVVVERKTSPNVAKEYVEAKGLTEGASGGSGKIVIGAANFAENQTLAEIYATVLDAAGFDATTKTLGNRELYLPALQKGTVHVVPEYAGTVTEFLNKRENGAGAKPLASGDLDPTVEALQGLGNDLGLKFGQPSQAADQNAFAVTTAFAQEHGVKTLSDLAKACGGGVTLGGPPECPQRPFCQPGLQKTYQLTIDSFRALDAGGPLTKTALRKGEVAVGLVFSSDGELAAT